MNIKKTISSMIVIGSLLATTTFPAFAAGGNVVGNYNLQDHGQGAWVGGPLFADGTLGGGGNISFNNGQEVAHVDPLNWVTVDPTDVNLCFHVTEVKGNQVPTGDYCFVLPVTGSGKKVNLGGNTYARVSFHG